VIGLEAHISHANANANANESAAGAPGSVHSFYAWLGWYRFGFTKSRGAQGER